MAAAYPAVGDIVGADIVTHEHPVGDELIEEGLDIADDLFCRYPGHVRDAAGNGADRASHNDLHPDERGGVLQDHRRALRQPCDVRPTCVVHVADIGSDAVCR